MRQTVSQAEQRLTALERKAAASGLGAVIVIYDANTGQPLQSVPPGARVEIWIPDNGRDTVRGLYHGERGLLPATGS